MRVRIESNLGCSCRSLSKLHDLISMRDRCWTGLRGWGWRTTELAARLRLARLGWRSGSLFNGHADPGTHMPGYKTPYPDAHPASRRPRPARGTPARRSHTPRGQSKTATLPLTWPACDRTGAHARPQEYGRTVSPPPVTHGAGVMWEGRGPEKGDRVVSHGCPRERKKKAKNADSRFTL